MSNQRKLHAYIEQAQRRLRLGAWVQGAAIFIATAVMVTVVIVLVLNHFAFAMHGLVWARVALLCALAVAASFGILLPLLRLSRARAVAALETANPELEQRLTTFQQAAQRGDDPFLELLAADTLERTQHAPPSNLVPDNRLLALGGAGSACLAVLGWMIFAGPGYMGYGALLLWTGTTKNAQPLYTIAVAPGNVTVRRNSDQLVTAQIGGMRPEHVQLFAHYKSSKGFEAATMQPEHTGKGTYQFVLAGLPESVEYYVAAGALKSPHYSVRVVDLPSVKRIHVTYKFPRWTGMKPATQDRSGDLRAIEGTDAQLELETDRPLREGQLLIEGGKAIQLTAGEGNHYNATIHMDKDGAYHLAALDAGQPVRLSEDYFIATDKAQPPQIAVDRPRGDYRASPIEEVTIGVNATDQFALNQMRLHYSVNGEQEQVVDLLKASGAKEAQGSHVLPLEDFKLAPGDLVSVYATARDGHAEARTDISFIQVEPFEREFSQSQQSGGGGGGGGAGQNNQTEISKREKELIAATWKQQNDKTASAKDAVVAGQFLSDAQQKLRDQVMALSARIESRDLSAATEEFGSFNQDMQTAAEAMAPSAQKLKAAAWKDALPLEQKALQALLRAEATFRKIQVAFGQSGGGASGGGDAGRDLASLFDLELDTEKNQYETAQSASPSEQREKQIEDALAKLDALAKRQQEQAEQRQNPQQSFEQRWQQEMLRREAEQLKREMEQMAKNGQQHQQGAEDSSSGGSAQHGQRVENSADGQGAHGTRNNRSGSPQSRSKDSDPRVQQALRRLQDATENMRRSAGAQQSQNAARDAADQLRQATNLLGGTQQTLASGKVDSLAQEAERLRQQEHAQAEQIDQLAEQQAANRNAADLTGMMDRLHARDRLAQQRQALSDDLSDLQRKMREGARALSPREPEAANRLRDALSEMDSSDLDTHVQRSADWLRRGINPNTNGTEQEIAQGLSKLEQQLHQAQQATNQNPAQQPARPSQDETATLDTIERLRSKVESMSRAAAGTRGSSSKGRLDQSTDTEAELRAERSAEDQAASGGQSAPDAQANSSRGRSNGNGAPRPQSGDLGGMTRDAQNGAGRSADSTAWGNINTGGNRFGPAGARPTSRDASNDSADTERTYEQGMREMNQLRQTVKGDPEATKAAEELAREMQRLDPRRFPGNPEILEQMHREVLASIDRLELQVQRSVAGPAQSRTGKPETVPAGYQDAVAEYYRQLSKSQ